MTEVMADRLFLTRPDTRDRQGVQRNPMPRRKLRIRWQRTLTLVLALTLTTTALTEDAPARPGDAAAHTALIAEIERIAAAVNGTVGVALLHLESGIEVAVNGEMKFPLASTYKIPMAALGLQLADRGELDLASMVALADERRVVSSVVDSTFPHPGVALSLLNLMEVMLTESDNTATDLFLEAIGGPAAVTGWLREIGIEDLRVDRSTVELLRDYAGTPAPEPGESYSAQYRRLLAEGKLAAFALDGASEGYIAFEQDPRDQGTPAAMSRLLAGLWRGELLSSAGIELLRGAMLRCRTGENRLRGRLPEGTVVAHKSGTITGTVNDVGVIALPGDRGRLVISVYVKNAVGDRASHERAIAEIARVAYDYFALNDFGSDD